MLSFNKGTRASAAFLLAFALVLAAFTGKNFLEMRLPDRVVPAPGFTSHMLSEWFPNISGTPVDTPVFTQDSGVPGGSVLIMGGTHPNEPAATMTAVIFLERANVSRGKLFVIPFANMSAFGHNSPQEASPQRIHFTLPDGSVRSFRYGSRATNPVHQWPNPDIYIHEASGQQLSGSEMANLNRAHPGVEDGPLTQRLARGLLELLLREEIDLAFDLHEASPEYPVVNAIVAHEKSMMLAAMVTMELEARGVPIRLEPSPKNLRGLTHREWGDATATMPILMETGNPSQGRLRGRTDEDLVMTGQDKFYAKAAELGRLFIPYVTDQPMDLRVARHTGSILTFLETLEYLDPEIAITVEGVPSYGEILEEGVGAFLSPVPDQ
ncbi:MAG TPA: succinylglutamate desuccinylase/aspartoacylase family protein [Synergistales bacterium]|jgi:hypothetical protein|nr:succinylglutamate desuccinylase/aspartoacylase family protein [Synergistales bacterium]HRW87856.1 succinylglutamate desuccinylase/aspartoacylase family protein [Thermovirgaceae bacterium]MDD5515204.1 succinylglutamate desuccinylase/aspartoacylase family protein [Synergistales bacterium]HOI81218.1 succinylglutamate desuccinylase/aspartoacylase family protein [Synergistales bacterium]HOP52372.1 succinylglutamate desuccinylase/aspartoacylase family protein [Synergistales bacterium]